jgi:putative endonuclease
MSFGRLGEDRAVQYFIKENYIVLCRNYRAAGCEIDIIAQRDGELIFAEVKTRSSELFGRPAEAVDLKKQKHLVTAAQAYLDTNSTQLIPRFDVLEVYMTRDGKNCRINHIPHAFIRRQE